MYMVQWGSSQSLETAVIKLRSGRTKDFENDTRFALKLNEGYMTSIVEQGVSIMWLWEASCVVCSLIEIIPTIALHLWWSDTIPMPFPRLGS